MDTSRPVFPHKHLTGIAPLAADDITTILNIAQDYANMTAEGGRPERTLKGKVILNLFFEDSTRTRTSFEMASKRLGAEVINWNMKTSSINKGETFMDTVRTLDAMHPDAIVIRHSEYGAPDYVAKRVSCPVLNAGDSWREHPTQALLDALTLRQYFGKLDGLTVAIVGDIAHSRVAASNMHLLTKMGATVRLVAPPVLLPEKAPVDGIAMFTSLAEGLPGADAVMTIRPQKERMDDALIEDASYFHDYGMTHEKLNLAGPDAVLLDPGPFLRGLMIDDDMADDKTRFLYDRQVSNGVFARMAALDLLVGG
ncbi:MAG: aspartate carbamoyltransferase catalytic subunit [Rhodospirillales bacterium]|nr:aspartate carbamoyltransferase catalytic subunit [Rhodospirillales bacterium]